MNLDDLTRVYGDKEAISKALGMTYNRIANWFYRKSIPMTTQYKIEVLSKGKLKADKE